MIKKTYIAPRLDVLNIEPSSLIATSIKIGDGGADAGQSFTNKHQGYSSNTWNDPSFSGSEQNFWDDTWSN
jgi:hypothetical protein